MIDLESLMRAVQKVFVESEYFPFLQRRIQVFGLRFERDAVLCNFSDEGVVKCSYCANASVSDADLWVELAYQEFLEFVSSNKSIGEIKVTAPDSSKVPIVLQMIAMRVFRGNFDSNYPLSDRENLIYTSIFGANPPVRLWQSDDAGVEVLIYEQAYKGLDVYVTSGFSNPDVGPSPLESDTYKMIGYGYELIMFLPPELSPLRAIFAYAASTINETAIHIVREQFVRFEEPIQVGKKQLAGLIVVTPTFIPDRFPLVDGIVYWNLLLGVDEKTLRVAEKKGVDRAVKLLDTQNHGDCTII